MSGGAFILVVSPKTQRLLLGLRNSETEWNPDTWFAFGGTMEPGETPLDTAIREFFEETKLTKDSYTLETDPLFHGRTVKNGVAHDLIVFLARMNCEVFPEIDAESQKWRWVSLSDIPHLKLHPALYSIFTKPEYISRVKKALLNHF